MNRQPLLCLIAIMVSSWMLPPDGEAQQTREVVTESSSKEYLFFLNDFYSLFVNVPDANRVKPSESKVQISSFTTAIMAAPTGVRDIPELRFECQGVTYVVPAHRINVLGPRLEGPGFFAESAPDPNGSGNVEVLVGWNSEGQHTNPDISLSYSKQPEGIEVVSSATSSRYSDKKYEWTMKLVLRNKTNQPYTLPKEFFRNLPELEEWPVVIIPPANAKH